MFAHSYFAARYFAPRYFPPPAGFHATVPADPIVDTSEIDFEETLRFPELISWGSHGGPSFKTEIVVMDAGHEQRNQLWSQPRCKYEAQWGVKTAEQYTQIIGFFRSMKGKKRGFRFKDWLDFSSVEVQTSTPIVTALDQSLGTGDGMTTTFQLKKFYDAGPGFTRNIVKPVVGTVRVAVDGTEVFSSWIVTNTGKVVFGIAPTVGAVLTAGFEFDIPCRFDTDELDLTIDDFEQVSGSVPLMEVRYRLSPANVGSTIQTGYPQAVAFPDTIQQKSCGSVLEDFTVTIDSAYSGNITVNFGNNPSGATLTNNTSSAISGVATFSDVGVSEAGTGYTLTATVDGYGTATSNSFDVVWAANAICLTHSFFIPLTLPSTARYLIFMNWFRGEPGLDFFLGPDLFSSGEPDRRLVAYTNGYGKNFQNTDATSDIIMQIGLPGQGLSDLGLIANNLTWHQTILTVDTVSKTFQYFLDGTNITSTQSQANGPGTGPIHLGPNYGVVISGGTLSDALFACGDTANFDLTNPANLALLRSGSSPVLVTSIPNFTIPIYLHGDKDTWGNNLGTGGGPFDWAFSPDPFYQPKPATSTPW